MFDILIMKYDYELNSGKTEDADYPKTQMKCKFNYLNLEYEKQTLISNNQLSGLGVFRARSYYG